MQRFIRYEGGQIGISGDRRAAAGWYCRHLGMTELWDGAGEGQTLLQFPGRAAAIPLVSAGGSVWSGSGGERRAGNVRLCFETPDLAATRAALAAAGVRVGPEERGPGGDPSFDFWDLEGTRLTATAHPELAGDYPPDRLVRYAPLRIGVRDRQGAAAWYGEHLGMTVVKDDPAAGATLMGLGGHIPIWLETLPAAAFAGRQPLYARPFFGTADIGAAHRHCADAGFDPSPVSGAPDALRVFHFYDPDGNQVHVWTYPGAGQPQD